MIGQLHAPACSSPGEYPLIPAEEDGGWAQRFGEV